MRRGGIQTLLEPGGPGVRIQCVVADELEGVAVELIASGFDRDADDATEIVTVGRRRILRDEVDLLDGVDNGREGYNVVVDLIVVDAVEDVVVGLLAVAVDIGTANLEARL